MNRRLLTKLLVGLAIFSPFAMDMKLAMASEQVQVTHAEVPSQIEFRVRMRKSDWTRDRGMKIKLVDVCNDTRCPADVQCLSVGNAQVILCFQVGTRSKIITLNTNKSPNTVVISGMKGRVGLPSAYVVKLNSLSPTPMAGKKIEYSLYTATLIIENAV